MISRRFTQISSFFFFSGFPPFPNSRCSPGMSRARHATTGHCFGLPAGAARASRASEDGRGGRWDFGAFLGILGGLNDENMADFWLIYGDCFFFW